jgi:hypothetical protein
MPATASDRLKTPRRRMRQPSMQTTSVHLPSDLLRLLRLVAVVRASRHGGRPSVSDILRELLEKHRREFETEARG